MAEITVGQKPATLNASDTAYTGIEGRFRATGEGTLTEVTLTVGANTDDTKVGTFSTSNHVAFTLRDYATIGTVLAGASRTFTGLSIDVYTNDYIGQYSSATGLRYNSSSPNNAYRYNGDGFSAGTFNCTNHTRNFALYAEGETVVSEKIIAGSVLTETGWQRIITADKLKLRTSDGWQ